MKKLTTLLILTVMLISCFGINVAAYDKEILHSITANYDDALDLAGRRTFRGKCNLATAYQLTAAGIFKDVPDYSGTGSSWHSYFRNVSETTGGYNIVTISGANCLYDLIDRYGNRIYNVVYSLGTGGTSGDEHVLFIRAIIDGNVYFADNFKTEYNHKTYYEGEGTVLSLDAFVAEYKRLNGNAYGCVYFTKDRTEHLAGSTENPADWKNDDKQYIEGRYIISSAALKIREKPNTHAKSVATLICEDRVDVIEIRNNWGKVEHNGVSGWICLTYTQKLSETSKSNITTASLTSDQQAVFSGNTITWTADVQSNTKCFYSFYIYKDNVKIYSGTFSTENTVSFTPEVKGVYKASVKITDGENTTAELFSNEIICVGEEMKIVHGDTDGDGRITANDSRLVLKQTAAMKVLTGKNFICTESDMKKITEADDDSENDNET